MDAQEAFEQGNPLNIALGVLKQLSREERVILGLFFYEGLSAPEAGKLLKKNEDEIAAVIQKIYLKISRELPASNNLDEIAAQIYG